MLSRYDDAEGKFSPEQIADKIEDFEEQVSGKLTNAPTGRFLVAMGIFGALVIPCGLPAAGAIALPFLVNAVKKALRNGHQAEYVAKTGIFCHLLNHREIAQLIRFTGRKFIIDQAVQAHIDGMKLTPAAIELVELIEGELTPTSFDEVKKAFAPETQKEPATVSNSVGNKTRLGAIDVPSRNASGDPSAAFDWSRINTEYDDFPHLFLLGKTGAGKSYLSDRLVRFLKGFTLVVTPKKKPNDFVGLQAIGLPYDYRAIHKALVALEKLMVQREKQMNETGNDNFTPINVILDELPVSSAGCKDEGLDLLKPLKALIRAGRTSKIRLIILAQGQEVKALGIEGEGGLRDNLVYVYLKGFVEKHAADLKLDISNIDRPCIIDGQIADTSFLQQFATVQPAGLDLGGQSAKTEKAEPTIVSTPQDLERMYNAPSAEHEAEETVSENSSSQPLIKQTFPNWSNKSVEVAAAIVDYVTARPDKEFYPSTIKQSVNRQIKTDDGLTADKIKSLLDRLVGAQLLTENNGRYSAIKPPAVTDDYDF